MTRDTTSSESAAHTESQSLSASQTGRLPEVAPEVLPNGVGICAVAFSGTMVGLHTIFHVQYSFKGADWRHPGEYLPAVLLLSMISFILSIVWLLSPNSWNHEGILQERYRKGTRFVWGGLVLMLLGIVYAVAISFEPVRAALDNVLPQFELLALPEK